MRFPCQGHIELRTSASTQRYWLRRRRKLERPRRRREPTSKCRSEEEHNTDLCARLQELGGYDPVRTLPAEETEGKRGRGGFRANREATQSSTLARGRHPHTTPHRYWRARQERVLVGPEPARRLIELINCPSPNPASTRANVPPAKPSGLRTSTAKTMKPSDAATAPIRSVRRNVFERNKVPRNDPRKRQEIRRPA